MKDSGVEWIGNIPFKWRIIKLKNLIESPLSYGANSSGIEYDDLLPRYIRITDISGDNKLKEDNKLSLSWEDAEAYMLRNNDLLFARSGGTVGKTFLYKEQFGQAAFAGYLIKASFKNEIFAKWVYLYSLSQGYNEWKNRIFIRATIPNIGASKYANMEIALPHTDFEIDKIINILERKLPYIDTIIEQTQSTIEDYKLLKQSIITEAVTKGLDKNVEMKDSGVVWIGQIPKHWEMKASGSIFSNSKDRAEISDEKLSSTQSHGVVPQSLFEEAEGRQVVSVNKNYELLKKVKKNTFVISLRSFQGGIEMSRYDGAISAAYTILIPSNEVNTEYFRFLFKSSAYIQAIQSTIIESVREGKSVSYSDFKTIKLPIFDYNEQAEIAMYLEKRTHEIDSLIAKKEHLISDLEAYKKSLIYEYVTGKKEVE